MKHEHHMQMSLKDIPKDTLKSLLKYITEKRKFLLTIIIIFILLSSLLSAYGMTLFGKITDKILKKSFTNICSRYIIILSIEIWKN